VRSTIEASGASKKSLKNAVMQTLRCFNIFLQKIASYRCLRGVVQVFVRAIWGKTRLLVDPATTCTALVVGGCFVRCEQV